MDAARWGRVRWQYVVDAALGVSLAGLFVFGGMTVSPLLAVAQTLPLAWRRRAPGAVLGVVGLATAAHMSMGMSRTAGYMPVLLAIYTAAASRSAAVRWGLCGLTVVVVAGTLHRDLVEGALPAVAVSAVAWLAGAERSRHLRERTALVAESTRLRLEQRIADAEMAAAADRERLARRLHDTLAHTVTVMLIQTEALRSTARLEPVDVDRVDRVLGAGRDALAEVRGAIAELDSREVSASADDLAERLDQLRAAGLDLSAALPEGLAGLPAPMLAVVHRLIGEAATNALRHGGPGTRLDLRVEQDTGRVTVSMVSDRGRGAGGARAGAGYGLRSLARDVETFGGTLVYGPLEGRSWSVVATFPLLGSP
ncbi:sensor histidine kinase [Streptosporangium canum]|uniref:sensor histidine kinase n=1 Tax=Streptosporangium canum TaxID=324952 RepID=UPI0036C8FCE6